LPVNRLVLLLETWLWLLTARAALAVIPVRYIFAWKRRPVRPGPDYSPAELLATVREVAWSVERMVNRSPIKFVCFPQCLAAIVLLRSVGIESRLHYGVARVDGQLITHAWLEAAGEVLVVGAAAKDLSSLGVY
jgi:hypothetical protein